MQSGSDVLMQAINFKRGDASTIELIFVRGTTVEAMPSTMEIRFAFKPPGAFSSPPLVYEGTWDQQDYINPQTVETIIGGKWVAEPNINTTQIIDFFAEAGEPDQIALKGELTFRVSETNGWNSSQTFDVSIENDLIKDDEVTPENAEEPTDYLTAVQSESRYVRYDAAQSLTGGQKTQSRTNIGALGSTDPLVRYDAQTLTAPERAQALANLGLTNALQVSLYAPGTHTWTNPSPSTARLVRVLLIGGGGGGGSGRKGDVAGTIGGGGSGAPGSVIEILTTTTHLSSTQTVTVGAGGAGGAGSTTNDFAGLDGAAGGNTTFGIWNARGGNAGWGSGATGNAGAGRTLSTLIGITNINSLAGAAGSATTGATATGSTVGQPTGGGGGGGVTSNVVYAGGTGGGAGNSLIGQLAGGAGGATEGAAGTAGSRYGLYGLGGGGGASALANNTAGTGGAGGNFGGGGGGGGGAVNGLGSSGAGGVGGSGLAIIVVF